MHRVIVVSMLLIGCVAKPPSAIGGKCNARVTHETPLLAASHVPQGSAVDWPSNPPTSGPHYPSLVEWTTASPAPLMRGNYLHNEEHGGIVLLYNCPNGCGNPFFDLATLGGALPQDPLCSGINARYVVTSDPLLEPDVSVAAAAWGWTYKADCVDDETLGVFIDQHYGKGGADRDNCTTGVPITP